MELSKPRPLLQDMADTLVGRMKAKNLSIPRDYRLLFRLVIHKERSGGGQSWGIRKARSDLASREKEAAKSDLRDA